MFHLANTYCGTFSKNRTPAHHYSCAAILSNAFVPPSRASGSLPFLRIIRHCITVSPVSPFLMPLWGSRQNAMTWWRTDQCEVWLSGDASQVDSREPLSAINENLRKADGWSLPMEYLPEGSKAPNIFMLWVSICRRCLPHEAFSFISIMEFTEVWRMNCQILVCHLSQFIQFSP